MAEKLLADDIEQLEKTLGPDWQLTDGRYLTFRAKCAGFAPAQQLANLAAFVSEHLNHHADISFGWGYVTLRITTHDVGGLSQLDFDFVNRFDAARADQ